MRICFLFLFFSINLENNKTYHIVNTSLLHIHLEWHKTKTIKSEADQVEYLTYIFGQPLVMATKSKYKIASMLQIDWVFDDFKDEWEPLNNGKNVIVPHFTG